MSTTYCPHCRRVARPRGRRVLHYTLCNGFIRSEEVLRAEEKDSVQ